MSSNIRILLLSFQLSVDPVQRITAENALKHGWLLGSFNDEKDSSNMCSISMVQARITVFLNRCKKTKR